MKPIPCIKKADVAGHPKVSRHVGLLVTSVPVGLGCSLCSHPTILIRVLRMSPAIKAYVTRRSSLSLSPDIENAIATARDSIAAYASLRRTATVFAALQRRDTALRRPSIARLTHVPK